MQRLVPVRASASRECALGGQTNLCLDLDRERGDM